MWKSKKQQGSIHSLLLPVTFLWGLIHHIGFLVGQTSIWMRDSQTGAVICRVCFEVIPAPRSSAVSDLSPRLSAKRPTGRNQPKLPLLIQRDRWIPSRSLFSSFVLFSMHRFHHSISLPACKKREREKEKETGSFYARGTILTTTTRYCINHWSDLLFTFRLLWLNLPSRCSSFTSDWGNTNGCFSASNPPLSFRPSIQITVAVEKILH